jgi:hypothetical protein
MRLAALNLLTINIFPAGESADFADSLSGNHLTVNYLTAAGNWMVPVLGWCLCLDAA